MFNDEGNNQIVIFGIENELENLNDSIVYPSQDAPPIQIQKKTIEKIYKSTLESGKPYYLLCSKWWNQWKKYVGFQNEVKSSENPRFITNGHLFSNTGTRSLRKGILEGADFEFVQEEVWNLLKSWFGYDYEIRRIASSDSKKNVRVQLFPLNVKVIKSSDEDEIHDIKVFTTLCTVKDFVSFLCKKLNLKEEDVRLRYYNGRRKLDILSDSSYMSECNIWENQLLLLEEKGENGEFLQAKQSTGYTPSGITTGFVPPGKTTGFVPTGKTTGFVPSGKATGFVPTGKTPSFPFNRQTTWGQSNSIPFNQPIVTNRLINNDNILAFTSRDEFSNKPINQYRWNFYSQLMDRNNLNNQQSVDRTYSSNKTTDIIDKSSQKINETIILSSNNNEERSIHIEKKISFLHLIKDQLTNIKNEKPKYSDYSITVKDRTFYLHKFILIIRCSELLNEDISHNLSSFSFEAIILALKYIYGGQLMVTDTRNMEFLKELCLLFKLLKISTAYHFTIQLINNKIKKYSDIKYIKKYEKWLNSREYDIIELFYNEMKYRRSIDNTVKTKMYILSRNNLEFIKKHEYHLEEDIQNILKMKISFESEFNSSIFLIEKTKPFADITYKFENNLIKAHKAILHDRCPFINDKLDKDIVDMNESNSLIFNLMIKYFYIYDTSFLNEYKNDYKTLLGIYFNIIETKKDYIELFNPIIEKIMLLISPNEMERDKLTEMINYFVDHIEFDSHMNLLCKYVNFIDENPDILDKKIISKNAIKYFRCVGIDKLDQSHKN